MIERMVFACSLSLYHKNWTFQVRQWLKDYAPLNQREDNI